MNGVSSRFNERNYNRIKLRLWDLVFKTLSKNKFKLGTVEREIGSNPPKSYNDIRKTNYDVKLTEDGKLDLYTHKKEKKEL